ncbi:helix-turn-helix domain-containing protein [Halobacterium yunchengense]|uniref:helix-turn-helix domain-containing protein n=1 Tax=Halobacterium yunchengense TaxID=3108497 RepID=UPI003008DE3C
MILARLDIELPPETMIRDVSTAEPAATFRLLSGVRSGDTAVELGEVVADDPVAAGDRIADHDAVRDYEWLEVEADRALGKYETTDTALYEFVADADLPPEYPVVVRDGRYEFDFVGTRAEFEGFRAAIEDAGRDYELLSLADGTPSESPLSDAQRETLETAVREGYFEVPRACSLADVADATGVEKSTASRTLRRAVAQVTARFLADPRD